MRQHLDKAGQALRSARLLLDAGDLDGAINRAYYACFDAARGTLERIAEVDTREVKTHSGLIRLFNLKVVKAGLMPRKAKLLKVLGEGELKRRLSVRAHAFSKSALEKIQKAGGSTELVVVRVPKSVEPPAQK